MEDEFSRMELLIGREAVDLLSKKKIAVFGLGGVGSYAVEALARCGTAAQAAEELGVDASTLSKKRKRYGI